MYAASRFWLTLLLTLVMGAASTLLSACGQKGPLYLPEEESSPTTPTQTEAEALPDKNQQKKN